MARKDEDKKKKKQYTTNISEAKRDTNGDIVSPYKGSKKTSYNKEYTTNIAEAKRDSDGNLVSPYKSSSSSSSPQETFNKPQTKQTASQTSQTSQKRNSMEEEVAYAKEKVSELSDDEKSWLNKLTDYVKNMDAIEVNAALSAATGGDSYTMAIPFKEDKKEAEEAAQNLRAKSEETGKTYDKYLQYVSEIKDAEDREKNQKAIKQDLNTGNKAKDVRNAAIMTAGDIVSSPVAGGLAVLENLKARQYADQDAPVNTNSYLYGVQNAGSDVESAVNERIDNSVGQFAYGTGVSIGKAALAMAYGGATAEGLGLGSEAVGAARAAKDFAGAEKIAKAGKLAANLTTLPMFGTSAYASTLQEAQRRGLDHDKAQYTAIAAGTAEMAFEELSLDHFWDIYKNSGKAAARNAIVNIIAQAGIEGSEEAATDIANAITDGIINRGESEYQQNVKEYGKEEATKMFLSQLGQDFLGGAISGGLMGGAGQYANYHSVSRLSSDAYGDGTEETFAEIRDAIPEVGNTKGQTRVASELKQTADLLRIKAKNNQNISQKEKNDLYQMQSFLSEQYATDDKYRQIVDEYRKSTPAENSAKGFSNFMQQTNDILTQKVTNPEMPEEAQVETELRELSPMDNMLVEESEGKSPAYISGVKGEEFTPATVEEAQEYTNGKTYRNQRNVDENNPKTATATTNDGEKVKIASIKNVKGEPYVTTDSGVTMPLSDVSLVNGNMQTLYNESTKWNNSQAYVDGYSPVVPVPQYIKSMENVYNYARLHGSQGTFAKAIKNEPGAKYMEDGLKYMYEEGLKKAPKEAKDKKGLSYGGKKVQPKVNNGERVSKQAKNLVENVAKKTQTEISLLDDDEIREKQANGNKELLEKFKQSRSQFRGFFNPNTNEINLNIDVKDERVFKTLIHEAMGEMMEAYAPEEVAELQLAIIDYELSHNPTDFYDEVRDYLQRYKTVAEVSKGEDVQLREAANEYVNDIIYHLFTTEEGMKEFSEFIADKPKSVFDKFIEFIDNLIQGIKDLMGSAYGENNQYKDDIEAMQRLRKMALDTWQTAIDNKLALENGETELKQASSLDVRNSINENPTKDADVRFSLDVPEEESKTLIAIHNLTAEKMMDSLGLGGFPMPSIAVTKAELGHTNYGNVSVLFGKDTIDPKKSRYNKVYSGDAYTPTFPTVEYKIDDNKVWNVADKVRDILGDDYEKIGYSSLDHDNVSDSLNRWNGDYGEAFDNNYTLKHAFLKDKGVDVDLKYTEEDLFPKLDNAELVVLNDKFLNKEYLEEISHDYEYGNKHPDELKEIRDLMNKVVADTHKDEIEDDLRLYKETGKKRYKLFANDWLNFFDETSFSSFDLSTLAKALLKYRNRGINKVVDQYKSKDEIKKQMEGREAEYKKWLNKLFDGVVVKKGIRNDKDLFTPSGNRRSWDVLHDDYSLTNIVNNMRKEPTTGQSFGGYSFFGSSTREFESISDIKSESDRLQIMETALFTEAEKEIESELYEIANHIKPSSSWDSFSAASDIAEAVSRYKTKSGVKRFLSQWYKVSDDDIDSIMELAKRAANLPTGYFEAKPQRAVDLSEIKQVIVPDSEKELITALGKKEIPYTTYKAGDVESRKEAVNSVPEIRFSIEVDSDGKELTEGQKEYFNGTKAIDVESEVYNGEERLAKVYHGTVREFYEFKREYANAEGDLGKGYYFTSNPYDVEENYANAEGKDLTNKIEREADILEGTDEYEGKDHEEIVAELKKKYITSEEPITLECYLNIQNPVYISTYKGNKPTASDYHGDTYLFTEEDLDPGYDIEDFDDEDEYYEQRDQTIAESIEELLWKVDHGDEISDIVFEAYYNGGIKFEDFKEKLNELYLEDEEGFVANEVARQVVEALGYDGIIDYTPFYKFPGMHLQSMTTHYVVFDSNQAKLITNENPTDKPDIRYSVDVDSEGNKLTAYQKKYFKDSKVVDDQGRLKVMYHGTERADFTVFDPEYADDGISLFFTDNETVAKGYSGTKDKVKFNYTLEDLNKMVGGYEDIVKEGDTYRLREYIPAKDDYKTIFEGTFDEMKDYVIEWYGEVGSGNYEVYLNVTNPYVVDANGSYWDELPHGKDTWTTRDYADYAKKNGYDGLIVNNVIDTAVYASNMEKFEPSQIVVAFDSNQVKSIENKTPTEDADIRYSLDVDYQKAYEENNTEEMDRLVRIAADENGYDSPKLYHGTNRFGFTQFDLDRMDDKQSIFLTNNPKIASTYSGSLKQKNINEGFTKDVFGLTPQELAEELNNNLPDDGIDRNYEYVNKETLEEVKYSNEAAIPEVMDLINSIPKDTFSDEHAQKNLDSFKNLLASYSIKELMSGDEAQRKMLHNHLWYLANRDELDEDIRNRFKKIEENLRKEEILSEEMEEDGILESMLDGYSLEFYKPKEAAVFLRKQAGAGIYSLYAKLGKTLTIDGNYRNWNDIEWVRDWVKSFDMNNTGLEKDGDMLYLKSNDGITLIKKKTNAEISEELHKDMLSLFADTTYLEMQRSRNGLMTTREIVKFAKSKGYDSVLFKNLHDNGGRNPNVGYVEFADIYTIFNPNNVKSADPITFDDKGDVIPLSQRFNDQENELRYSIDVDSEGSELTEEQQKFFANSKVRDEEGRLIPLYHTTNSIFTKFNTSGIWLSEDKDYSLEYADKIWQDRKAGAVYDKNEIAPKLYGDNDTYTMKLYANITNPFDSTVFLDNTSKYLNSEFAQNTYKAIGITNVEDFDKYRGIVKRLNHHMVYELFNDSEFHELLKKFGFDGIKAVENSKLLNNEFTVPTWCAFDSSQVKLATNGNPSENEDIRFSLEVEDKISDIKKRAEKRFSFDQADLDLLDSLAEGQSYNKVADDTMAQILSSINNLYKGQEVGAKSIQTVAKEIKEYTGSTISTSKLEEQLKTLFDYMQRADNELNTGEMFDMFKIVAGDVVDKMASEKVDDSFRDFMRTETFRLTDDQKKEVAHVFGSYENFRKKYYGTLKIRNDATSTLDGLWNEITEQSFYGLDKDTPEAEQPIALVDFLDAMKDQPINNFGASFDELSTDVAIRILEKYFAAEQEAMTNKALLDNPSAKKALDDARANMRKADQEFRKQVKDKYDEEVARLTKERDDAQSSSQFFYNRARDLENQLANASNEEDKKAIRKLQSELDKKEKALIKAKAQSKAPLSAYQEQLGRADEKRKIMQISNRLMKMVYAPTEKLHMPEEFREPIGEFLNGIDFITHRGDLNAIDKLRWQTRMDNLRHYLSELSSKPNATQNELNLAELLEDELLEDMEKFTRDHAEDKKISRMSKEDLHKLYNILTRLSATVSKTNETFANSVYADMTKLNADSYDELTSLNDKKVGNGVMQSIKDFFSKTLEDPVTYFSLLGKAPKTLFDGLLKGFDRRTGHIKEAQEYMNFLPKDAYKWEKQKHTFVINGTYDVKGEELELTTTQIMTLYELNKRKAASHHLFSGGIKALNTHLLGYTSQSRKAYHLTEADLRNIFGVLTTEQIEAADKMQEFMANNCADWGNNVSMTLWGYKKFTEKDYFPMKVDSDSRATSNKDTNVPNFYSNKNISASKELKEMADNPLVIGDIFDVFTEHVADMATYDGMVLPQMDAMRWYNYKVKEVDGQGRNFISGTKQELNRIYGQAGLSYFTNLMLGINGAEPKARGVRLQNALIGRYKKVAVTAKIRVAIQQPTAFVRAYDEMDGKYLTKALATTNPVKYSKIAKQNSNLAWWKGQGYYESYLGKGLKEIIVGKNPVIQKAEDLEGWGAQTADDLTWGVLYHACELEIKDKYPELTGKEFTDTVVTRFEDLVSKTQVVDTMLHRTDIMRSQGDLTKLATSFMTEPLKTYNMLMRSVVGAARDKDKKALRKLIRTLFVYVANAAILSIVTTTWDALRKDDDETKYTDKWLELYGQEAVDNLNPLQMIPFVKDVVDIVNAKLTGEYRNATDMTYEGITKAAQFVAHIGKKITGENVTVSDYGLAKEGVQALSILSGVPVYNVWNDIEGIHNGFFDNWETKVQSPYKDFYKAIDNDGDIQQEVNNLKELGKDETTIKKQITNTYKQTYLDTTDMTEKANLKNKLIKAYTAAGDTREQAIKKIDKW